MVVLGLQSFNLCGHGRFIEKNKNKKHLMGIVKATKRDDSSSSSSSSQRFEIDRDKAREALKQLDQQIESQADEKKPRILFVKSDIVKDSSNDPIMYQEPPEISGSFLTTLAFILLALTLFYNILFITVIKPSIDGPESVPSENRVAMSDSDLLQFPLSSSPEKPIKQ